MALNDIDEMLDHLRRIKSGGDLNDYMINQVVNAEMMLRLLRTFIKHHVLFPDSLVEISEKIKHIVKRLHLIFAKIQDECESELNVGGLVSQLQMEFMEVNTRLGYNYELNASYLLEYVDCLGTNMDDVGMFLKHLDKTETHHELNEGAARILNQCSKQVKIIQKKMGFFRYLYATEINGYVDREKLDGLETRIQFMADKVGLFCLDIWASTFHEDFLNDILSETSLLLCLIVLVELEMQKIFLGELKMSKFCQSKTFKYQKLPNGFSHNLYSVLVYLRNKKLELNFPNNDSARNVSVAMELLSFLADVSDRFVNDEIMNKFLEKVGVLVGDVLCVIAKLLPNSIIKGDISKIKLCSIQILEKTENLKGQVETYYKSIKFSSSKFPTVGGLSFLDALLWKLNEMLKSESGLDFMMNSQVGILERELSSLTSVFRAAAKMQHENEALQDLKKRTINLAYEAEIAIDSALSRYDAHRHICCSLPIILREIKHISAEVTEMWSKNLDLEPCFVVDRSRHTPTQRSYPMIDEGIVGFEQDIEKIIHSLTRGTNELDVIPIVGMGGQGKTTIARNVYNNDMIVSHFDRLAWCCISQIYDRIQLLREIYDQISKSYPVDEDDEVAGMLKKSLMGRRYLIVLDDMWNVKAWDDLRLSFPNGEEGSRIVVTTRLKDVCMQIKYHSDPYSLPFLTPKESCELLQKRVFQMESCPSELQDVSLEVAERCKGLPLAILLVAGIIRRKKMEVSWWDEVNDSLLSYLGESEEYSLSTMKFSYDNLPDHIKPCLLYMGMFAEDESIPVSKLVSLWIAEGFVQNIESGSLEEAAEGYLMDLISSNVVMVSKRGYSGEVKYCQVHDVVLHFCLETSREEKFMLVVDSHLQPFEWKENRVRFDVYDEPSKTWKPFHQHLRTLMTIIVYNIDYWNPFSLVSNLRLLKVLDLSSHTVSGTLSTITLHPLIHLKYVAVDTYVFEFHPESLLLHLETLLVNCDNVVPFPANFWKMKMLRHVELSKDVYGELEINKQLILEKSSKLENLRTLKKVQFLSHDADSMASMLQRCPNLQQLSILVYDDCAEIPNLESLTQLQSLHLEFRGDVVVSELHLPSNLKKLAITGCCTLSTASFIGGLPSLEYLKLEDLDFESNEWSLGDITFDKLKLLKLGDLCISRWDASEESFPMLETLVINNCRALNEIPPSFADIQTLKQINLISWVGVKESLQASAMKIKDEIEAIEGCDRLDVIIQE